MATQSSDLFRHSVYRLDLHLMCQGPGAGGPKLRAARRAVLKAMESHMDAKARARARDAFEAAAKEAGISVD